ncbi:MAG: alkaline phosphatase [bacterium]
MLDLKLPSATRILLLAGLLLWPTISDASPSHRRPRVKNVILMIADGWGFNHVDAASLYETGRLGSVLYERFPFQWAMTTYNEGGSYDPSNAVADFSYVCIAPTDSAAAGTALATGFKTSNGAIAVAPDGTPLETILERAELYGKATGVVTTVPFSHATPAAFTAHNPARGDYSGIAQEMIYDSRVDVIMGTGHPWFDNDANATEVPRGFHYVGGETTWLDLLSGSAGGDADGDGVADPWVLVDTLYDFRALMTGPTPKRVIGIAQVHLTLQQSRSGDQHAAPFEVPANQGVPTLAEMTSGALNILDDDPDGLLLVVEGGAVDWASHASQSGRMIEEMLYFNQAVEVAVTWIEQNSNWGETVLIVTGDHETGHLSGPRSDPTDTDLIGTGAGILPLLTWHSSGHTNKLIPLFAKGADARLLGSFASGFDPVRGEYLDNTDVGEWVFAQLQ